MKKQCVSTRQSSIDRFIANHSGGNVVEKYLAMSTSWTEEEMLFLRTLANTDPLDKRMSNCRRTIDLIIDAKSSKKTISEVIPIVRRYSENECTLSREFVATITANICAEALESYVATYRSDPQRNHSLLLELEAHRDLMSFATVLKDLNVANKFNIDGFKIRYFKMKNVPLEVLWHFQAANLVRFPSYIYSIADDKEAVNHVKKAMIELLCSLSTDSDGPTRIAEAHMEIEEMATPSNVKNAQFDEPEVKLEKIIKNEGSLWEIRKEMIKDLMTSLICVAQSTSSDMEIVKSNCKISKDILDGIVNEAMNQILSKLLNSSGEENMNDSYLSLLLQVPTLSKDVVESFFTRHFVIILTYKPTVDSQTAISQQSDWTYSRSSAGLTSLIESVLMGLEESCLGILKDVIQKGELNWKTAVICVSTYLRCIPDSGKNVKSLVDWLLNKALLNKDQKLVTATFIIARQCCLEGCSPLFSSYITWFGTTFGAECPWFGRNPAMQQTFEFFIQFLTDIVPYEPPACLKVHINKAPQCPPNAHSLLMDYVALAKTRLKDLKEAPGFGLFGPELSTEQDIEEALRYFETHNGEIAQTLLDASLFRRQHFEQEFLGKLLSTKPIISHAIRDIQNTKAKFITKLHNMGKIPHSLFNRYQAECSATTQVSDIEFMDSPELFESVASPIEQFHMQLCNLLECMKGSNHYWEGSETHLPPPVRDALEAVQQSVKKLIEEKGTRGAVSVPSEQIVSGSVSEDSHRCAQIVDELLNTFYECNTVKSHIFHQKFVEIFHTLSMKIMLLHRIFTSCISDSINSANKLKVIVAIVHSIEYLGNTVFPHVCHDGEDISFATFLAQHFPLQNSHEMEFCFRFAVEYMHYADRHLLSVKQFLPDVKLNTVPPVLVKKYLYLSKRYKFAEGYNLNGLEKYNPDTNNLDVWTPLLMNVEMSFSEWFKQEASVKASEDILISRHEYLLNRLTESAMFDSMNINCLATGILHSVYSSDISRDNGSTESANFHKDILQALSELLETFPLVTARDEHPWLLQEWLKLPNNIVFFRIVSALPPWLLYCDSRTDVPSESTVQAVAEFVMIHLKNILCDENGFLHMALVRFLLTGLCMTCIQDKLTGAVLFNSLFEFCPALIVASRVHLSIVVPIIQKFSDSCSETTSTLKHLLKSLPNIRSGSPIVPRDKNMVSHWEVALDLWLERKSASVTDPQVHRWLFFYNMLKLGSQLQNGTVSCKFESESLSFCYPDTSTNITTVLITEIEKDASVIDTLDVISKEKSLPYCGISELLQNLLSTAGLLLLLQYNSVKNNESNQFLLSSSNATLLCKVLLSCFGNWIRADSPVETFQLKREHKKMRLSPLVNTELLTHARSLFYSVLNTMVLKQAVTVPSVYFERIGDAVIESIFQL